MPIFRHRCPAQRRGAQAVEFAIVAPLFFLFVFAIIDIGRSMMVVSLLNNAARTGARVGVIPGKTTGDIQAAANQAVVGVSGMTTTVKVNGADQDASAAQSGDSITVSVSAPASSVTWLPITWFVTGTLRGQFTLQRE